MLHRLFYRIPPVFRNFYLASGFVFLVWMLFFDSNNLIAQWKLSHKLSTLENQQEYYAEKIEEVKKDREELLSDPEKLEKYAREKYFMKKPSEEIYVLVEE